MIDEPSSDAGDPAHVAPFTSRELVGLLADPHRRAVVAALILGGVTLDELGAATALDVRALTKALGRLTDAGLVVRGDDGAHYLLEEAFRLAARAEAPTDGAEAGTVDAVTAEERKVLRAFVRDGRILQIPMQRAKRLVLLELLAAEFEPGRRYTEAAVNVILGRRHPDTAAWRRYLVDESFLARDHGEYWRIGGRYDP